MALIIKTDTPEELLRQIKQAIDAKEVELWSYDSSGDFVHTPERWINRAWFRPEVNEGELRLGILGNKEAGMTSPLYAAYHSGFINLLLNHFDKSFSTVEATATKTTPDYY